MDITQDIKQSMNDVNFIESSSPYINPSKILDEGYSTYEVTTDNTTENNNVTDVQPKADDQLLRLDCSKPYCFLCSICNFSTTNSRIYLTHLRDAHDVKYVIHESKFCSYASRIKGHLKRHLLLKHDQILCSVCNFTTKLESELVKHEEEEHFRCEICNCLILNKAKHSVHVEKHSKPIIKCINCNFCTKYAHNMNRHMKMKHGGDSGPLKSATCNTEKQVFIESGAGTTMDSNEFKESEMGHSSNKCNLNMVRLQSDVDQERNNNIDNVALISKILKNPENYIGSVQHTRKTMLVYDMESKAIVQKEASFVTGLCKIFNEILINAANNKKRDKNMSSIKIDINYEKNLISVWNDGQGIPVSMHKPENILHPTKIFGHFLSSSDDNVRGAKLTNVFSSSFEIETASEKTKRCFKQMWTSNMMNAGDRKIKPFESPEHTNVQFSPDLPKFHMSNLKYDNSVEVMMLKACDIAVTTPGITVTVCGNELPFKTFKDFVNSIKDKAGNSLKFSFENVNEKCEIAIGHCNYGPLVHLISTAESDQNINDILNYIVSYIIAVIRKMHRTDITPLMVKNHLCIIFTCSKEYLANFDYFITIFKPSEKFIIDIAENLCTYIKPEGLRNKHKSKILDAAKAGTEESNLCTLIITEGDSGKSFALSGLDVLNKIHYGIFPLCGKVLNCKGANNSNKLENYIINNLVETLGIEEGKNYLEIEALKTLRYGKVIIMCDDDDDGFYIVGLLFNFFHSMCEDLLKLDFFTFFISPIIKVFGNTTQKLFYTWKEFNYWEIITKNKNEYKVIFLRGLGSSSPEDARECFRNIQNHIITLEYKGPEDDYYIKMFFNKECSAERGQMIRNYYQQQNDNQNLYSNEEFVYNCNNKREEINSFTKKRLLRFSIASNVRAISFIGDLMKPTIRKIMSTYNEYHDKEVLTVCQLANSVTLYSGYQHGESSLRETIIRLTQDYPGSNNLNIFEGISQFGTRLCGGKDHGSSRYIYLKMSDIIPYIFKKRDEPLLIYNYEGGRKTEPKFYLPIIPWFVNGCEGIGLGCSTELPKYDPRDLSRMVRDRIEGKIPNEPKPYYRYLEGEVDEVDSQIYVNKGKMNIDRENFEVEITELPACVWTDSYKINILNQLKDNLVIIDYKDYSTTTTVRFICKFTKDKFEQFQKIKNGFYLLFQLTQEISIKNFIAFDTNNKLHKYNSIIEAFNEYYPWRYKFYVKIKEYLKGELKAKHLMLKNKVRFAENYISIFSQTENMINMIEELIKQGYSHDPIKEFQKRFKNEFVEEVFFDNNYDYLINLPTRFLKKDQCNLLIQEMNQIAKELQTLEEKTPEDLWLEDLKEFDQMLESDINKPILKVEHVDSLTYKVTEGINKKRILGEERDEKEELKSHKRSKVSCNNKMVTTSTTEEHH